MYGGFLLELIALTVMANICDTNGFTPLTIGLLIAISSIVLISSIGSIIMIYREEKKIRTKREKKEQECPYFIDKESDGSC